MVYGTDSPVSNNAYVTALFQQLTQFMYELPLEDSTYVYDELPVSTSASQITLKASGVAVFQPVFQMGGLAEADLPNTVSRIQQAVDGDLSGAKALTLALGMTRFTYPSQSELTLPLAQGSQDYSLVALNIGEALNPGLVQWNSSDSTVASFTSGTGTLTLKKNGSTTITASVNGYAVQQFTVTVGTPLTATVKSITVDGNPV